MSTFDYAAMAELFPAISRRTSKRIGYRRFPNAALAIRYAIEELPSDLLLGTVLQVEDLRFDKEGIRQLYDDGSYPLPRRPV